MTAYSNRRLDSGGPPADAEQAAKLIARGLAYKDKKLSQAFKLTRVPSDNTLQTLKCMFDTSKTTPEETVKMKDMVLTDSMATEFEIRKVMHAWMSYAFPENVEIYPEDPVEDTRRGSVDLALWRDGQLIDIMEFKLGPLNFEVHRYQLMRYAADYMRENPSVTSFSLILTNGKEFLVGQAVWETEYRPMFYFDPEVRDLKNDLQYFCRAALYDIPVSPPATYQLVVAKEILRLAPNRVLGIGTFSAVFETKTISPANMKSGKKFALKLGDGPSLELEKKLKDYIESKIDVLKENGHVVNEKKDRPTLPVIGTYKAATRTLKGLLYDIGKPVTKSSWTARKDKADLKPHHFKILLRKLSALHSIGILHRDLRPNNIVLVGDEPYIMDLGCSTVVENNEYFAGSVITGSQRALQHYTSNPPEKFQYTVRDDLESFFKMWFLWAYQIEVPSDSGPETNEEFAARMLEFWAPICHFLPTETENLISKLNLAVDGDDIVNLYDLPNGQETLDIQAAEGQEDIPAGKRNITEIPGGEQEEDFEVKGEDVASTSEAARRRIAAKKGKH